MWELLFFETVRKIVQKPKDRRNRHHLWELLQIFFEVLGQTLRICINRKLMSMALNAKIVV
ncbi:hypothetical protein B1J93_11940 [Leptospira kirschneri serovar Pomona]|uniref:Uncharacterized protein n=1 Tax=Leptospira kirschneri serovar Pomona TaxID=561005 RepID=A0A1T1DLP7_9LEPT|nr:hypothetical protein B1J93_11940 [Leptospira kirschneri serovar Pomona]